MKPMHCGLGMLAAALVGGVLSNAALSGGRVEAQTAAPAGEPGRYQIKTFAVPGGGIAPYGCYVLDTATGALWRVVGATKADKVPGVAK